MLCVSFHEHLRACAQGNGNLVREPEADTQRSEASPFDVSFLDVAHAKVLEERDEHVVEGENLCVRAVHQSISDTGYRIATSAGKGSDYLYIHTSGQNEKIPEARSATHADPRHTPFG